MTERTKEALQWAGTICVLILSPIWIPICLVIYEVPWKEMGRDIVKMHNQIWSKS